MLRKRARRAGLSEAEACRRAGIARSTPAKWREQAPKTIRALDALEDVVAAEEAKR